MFCLFFKMNFYIPLPASRKLPQYSNSSNQTLLPISSISDLSHLDNAALLLGQVDFIPLVIQADKHTSIVFYLIRALLQISYRRFCC